MGLLRMLVQLGVAASLLLPATSTELEPVVAEYHFPPGPYYGSPVLKKIVIKNIIRHSYKKEKNNANSESETPFEMPDIYDMNKYPDSDRPLLRAPRPEMLMYKYKERFDNVEPESQYQMPDKYDMNKYPDSDKPLLRTLHPGVSMDKYKNRFDANSEPEAPYQMPDIFDVNKYPDSDRPLLRAPRQADSMHKIEEMPDINNMNKNSDNDTPLIRDRYTNEILKPRKNAGSMPGNTGEKHTPLDDSPLEQKKLKLMYLDGVGPILNYTNPEPDYKKKIGYNPCLNPPCSSKPYN